jgi:hypothetical protein
MRSLATIHLCVVIVIVSVAGCASSQDSERGTLQIPLEQYTGVLFHLSAEFAISGPGGTFTVDTRDDAPTMDLALQPGAYTVTMLDGWHLERFVDGWRITPTSAQLGSANPVPVTISRGETAAVAFVVLLELQNHGNLSLTFGVLPPHARLIGTLHATDATGTLSGYVDYPVTFAVSYSLSTETTTNTLPRSHGVSSISDELAFTDDPLGVLAADGTRSGGSLRYEVALEPDDSQVLYLSYSALDDTRPRRLSTSAVPLTPKLPVDESGMPSEPGAVGLSTTTGFTLTVGDLGSMTGAVDLQFDPKK